MGEIADSMINGDFDFITGEYIGKGGGYPRTNQKINKPKNSKPSVGVKVYMIRNQIPPKKHTKIIKEYFTIVLGRTNDRTLNQMCSVIQKDFKQFKEWFQNNKTYF